MHGHGDRARAQVEDARPERTRVRRQHVVVVRAQVRDRTGREDVADGLGEDVRSEVDGRRGVDVAVDQVDAALAEGRAVTDDHVDDSAVIVRIGGAGRRRVRVRHTDRRAAAESVVRQQRHHADSVAFGAVDEEAARAQAERAAHLDLARVLGRVVPLRVEVRRIRAVGHAQDEVRVSAGDRSREIKLGTRGRIERVRVGIVDGGVVEISADRRVRRERDRPGETVDAFRAVERRGADAGPGESPADGDPLRDVQVVQTRAREVPGLARRRRGLEHQLRARLNLRRARPADAAEATGVADEELGARAGDGHLADSRVGAVEVRVPRRDVEHAREGGAARKDQRAAVHLHVAVEGAAQAGQSHRARARLPDGAGPRGLAAVHRHGDRA